MHCKLHFGIAVCCHAKLQVIGRKCNDSMLTAVSVYLVTEMMCNNFIVR